MVQMPVKEAAERATVVRELAEQVPIVAHAAAAPGQTPWTEPMPVNETCTLWSGTQMNMQMAALVPTMMTLQEPNNASAGGAAAAATGRRDHAARTATENKPFASMDVIWITCP
jgi:hypothetical protein